MHQRTQFFGTGRIIIAGRCNERYCSQWLDPKGNGHEASFSGRILTNTWQSSSCFLEHLGGFVVLLCYVNMLHIVLHLLGNRLYLLYHKSEIPGPAELVALCRFMKCSAVSNVGPNFRHCIGCPVPHFPGGLGKSWVLRFCFYVFNQYLK